LTGALHVLWLQLSPPLPSSFASINTGEPRFTWKMAVKMERYIVIPSVSVTSLRIDKQVVFTHI